MGRKVPFCPGPAIQFSPKKPLPPASASLQRSLHQGAVGAGWMHWKPYKGVELTGAVPETEGTSPRVTAGDGLLLSFPL